MRTWGEMGPAATKEYIASQKKYAQQSRRRTVELLQSDYRGQRKMLTSDFRNRMKQMQKGVSRSAAARGLGQSTMALALKPTETMTAQRQQALGQLRSGYLGDLAAIPKVPTHFFDYMQKKSKYGALEPWELYRQDIRGSRPIGSILGGIAGGMFGGPVGAMAGAQIGGNI